MRLDEKNKIFDVEAYEREYGAIETVYPSCIVARFLIEMKQEEPVVKKKNYAIGCISMMISIILMIFLSVNVNLGYPILALAIIALRDFAK